MRIYKSTPLLSEIPSSVEQNERTLPLILFFGDLVLLSVVLGAERPMVKVFSTRGYSSSGEVGASRGTLPLSGGTGGALAGLKGKRERLPFIHAMGMIEATSASNTKGIFFATLKFQE